ncbi:MAG TPA: hypothetical protein PK112_08165, partial [candidate division Zixibacteria bacterium]|nr:hypothetical protein [candidate division Zixibacteria bacterium]
MGGVYVAVHKALPGSGNLATYRPRLATRIFSTERYADGRETHTLLGRVYKQDREPEQLRNIPRDLKFATIAVEDPADGAAALRDAVSRISTSDGVGVTSLNAAGLCARASLPNSSDLKLPAEFQPQDVYDYRTPLGLAMMALEK